MNSPQNRQQQSNSVPPGAPSAKDPPRQLEWPPAKHPAAAEEPPKAVKHAGPTDPRAVRPAGPKEGSDVDRREEE
eukprot:CAMPEP_0170504962 /NCGR_PEP_ID=MMETSP0208-20121228/49462_1 /TAXON_ID=197538 /ORGANISM="Strombidium inclinatum, Strain S3" /LENGTH=74 /DNA_ID=CAMNT_0010785519 /DNA_START=537 /DNA_END=757 /DNA_ORIENTATION=+